ncbi:hypothetical protein [Halomonas sp. A40-4]|nr:hypothetical protein [Halomonas sp. A40-4]
MELPFVGDARESGGAFFAYATAAINHDSGGILQLTLTDLDTAQ